ncbi:stemmadenine O-acetyltransferase-like [Primulina huaijiensis]|uniref:stemmadenine O-acetyltransferase-like n=1 Tax=Primulina huaijiensis TaxID=1492673 RepID=UPI003CC6E2DA
MEGSIKCSRVKVTSLLSVVSSKPVEAGKVHKLSKLDQEMGHRKVQVIFYYESNPFIHGSMSDQLDNLRVSLSRLLNDYPVVTGRLTRDPDDGGWQIKCNDAGVRMVRAKVSTTLVEWLRSADAEEEQDLMVWEDMPQDPSFWSPFRIQITNFECGGMAIALRCHHMQADITSATLLIKSWTDVHRGQPLLHPPIFQLSAPPTGRLIPTFETMPNHEIPRKMATLTMKFSSNSVEKCMSQVRNQCPEADPDPFEALVALLWSRITRWQEPTSFGGRKCWLSICVDLRNRGPKSVPLGYFGNAMRFSSLSVDVEDLTSPGIGNVANYIHSHVADLKGDDKPYGMYDSELTCINTENILDVDNGQSLMYAAKFDKGKEPVHVSYSVGTEEGQGLIIVMPAREPGLGRTVSVTLPEEQIANLRKDHAILEFEPTMIISGKL